MGDILGVIALTKLALDNQKALDKFDLTDCLILIKQYSEGTQTLESATMLILDLINS